MEILQDIMCLGCCSKGNVTLDGRLSASDVGWIVDTSAGFYITKPRQLTGLPEVTCDKCAHILNIEAAIKAMERGSGVLKLPYVLRNDLVHRTVGAK
jgi:hypothetical protein